MTDKERALTSEFKLVSFGILVAAFQLVCRYLAQTQTKDAKLNRPRSAVVGNSA